MPCWRRPRFALSRREDRSVTHKRVQLSGGSRGWREQGLQRPADRKRQRSRAADGSVPVHRAEQSHQVWAMDLRFDATADGPDSMS